MYVCKYMSFFICGDMKIKKAYVLFRRLGMSRVFIQFSYVLALKVINTLIQTFTFVLKVLRYV